MTDNAVSSNTDIKTAFSRIGKSIAVITLADSEGRHATISSAFMNLTNEPPTLLFALEKSSSLYAKFTQSQVFAINVLGEEHSSVVDACARQKGEARFGQGQWLEDEGTPVLADAQAVFVCAVVEHSEFATHGVFIAQVKKAFINDDVAPLVYVGGGLRTCK